jgi:hypothetical protein
VLDIKIISERWILFLEIWVAVNACDISRWGFKLPHYCQRIYCWGSFYLPVGTDRLICHCCNFFVPKTKYILVGDPHTPFDGNAYQIGTHFTRILCEIFIDISNVVMSSLHKWKIFSKIQHCRSVFLNENHF